MLPLKTDTGKALNFSLWAGLAEHLSAQCLQNVECTHLTFMLSQASTEMKKQICTNNHAVLLVRGLVRLAPIIPAQ